MRCGNLPESFRIPLSKGNQPDDEVILAEESTQVNLIIGGSYTYFFTKAYRA